MKRSDFKQKPRKQMKRTRIRVKGKSDTATKKQDIQDIVRLIVTHRDGGCILRDVRCGNEASVVEEKVVSEVTIQADHLVTRANSATYADTRLIVCVCQPCHFWKKYHEKEYEALVKTIISKDRVKLWEKCELDRQAHKTSKMDWSLELVALNQELKKYA